MSNKLSSKDLGRLADPLAFREPIDIKGQDLVEMNHWLDRMVLIRATEEKIGDKVEDGTVKCPCHLVIGQEVPAAGVAAVVTKGDKIFGAHRSHAHYLALGGDLRMLFAEILGKDTGCSKGMGGSMHLIDRENGLYGTVPIVGGTIPIATGAGLASKLDGGHDVAVSFLGDGATEEGAFHESLNLAAVMKLPVVYVVENNLFSSHLHISLRQPCSSVCRYAESHDVPWQRVDGNDLVAMKSAASQAFDAARSGSGPQLIEAVTYRWRGHVGHREDNDVGVQRTEGLADWKKRDPIGRLFEALKGIGSQSDESFENLWTKARGEVESAWTQAEADPFPESAALLDRVYKISN